jgi:hypothetical protein
MTQTVTEQTTIEAIEVDPQEEIARENLRHIVNPPGNLHIWKPGMEAQDIVDIARVKGIEVRALCGAEFVPTRNPEDVKQTCNACLDIAGEIMDGI